VERTSVQIMQTIKLVKRLWEMGLVPFSFCPETRHGNQYVGVFVPIALALDLPAGWTLASTNHNEDTYLCWWEHHEWHKELGKRENFINSSDGAAQGE
jgi:hypothetical protein